MLSCGDRDPLNVLIELPAHILTVMALSVDVVGTNHSGSDPTAGRELLAVAVLLQWMRLLRFLQVTEEFGPVVLMVVRMLSDMLNFFVMFIVIMISFSSGFFTLYKDPTQDADHDVLDEGDCKDYDEEFNSWRIAFVTLMEAMLAQDGEAICFRATSQPVVGTGLMYSFMLVGVIMMVNMLIVCCWDSIPALCPVPPLNAHPQL